MDYNDYPDTGPTKNEQGWINLAERYKAELERQKAQNSVLYRQAQRSEERLANVERQTEQRVKRLTRALRMALKVRATAFAAGFNECLELLEAGIVPEKMHGEDDL